MYPQRRYRHAMAAGDNGRVYMFGGSLMSKYVCKNIVCSNALALGSLLLS